MKKKHLLWLLPLLAALLLCLACGGETTTEPERDYDPKTGEVIIPGQQTPVSSNPNEDSEIIAIVTPEPDLHRDELNAILKRATMLDGVTVNGVSVGGMTLDEAKAAIQQSLDAQKKDLRVTVTLGDAKDVFSADSIQTTDNLDEMLTEAFNLVREDKGFEAVTAEVNEIKANGRDFPVRIAFREDALRSAVDAFAEAHETKPVNASVGYNKEENKIDFTPDVVGRSVDREALVTALLDAKSGDTIEAPAAETHAEITLADVQQQYVLRSSFTTKFSKSIDNRKFNICKGAGMITGTILHPGDTFSANGTLGTRKKENGWKVATAYVQGTHEKQYGGGVCQLSSTLYNAAVLADMNIVDRKNHSMPVDYVDKGRDATINSVGNLIDFKFQNSSKSDIIIIAYVDNTDYKKAGTLTMEIWGIPISEDSNGEYDEIRIPTPKKTKTIKPSGDVKYEVDVTKPVGYKKIKVKNQNGSVWESTKEYYLNGVLVKSEKLATSTYKAYSAVYTVGPDAPEPSDTPKPDKTPKPDDPTPSPSTPPPADPTPDKPDPTPDKPDPTPDKPDPTPDKPDPTPDKPDPTPDPTPKPTDPPSGGGDDGDDNGEG